PKGWPMPGRKDCDAAAQEAKEEAGVVGRVDRRPLGRYSYFKRFQQTFETCSVVVYVLHVAEELPDWRERNQRRKLWLSPHDASE
ncbi:NUDIX domain-containing protein, partial [Mycobacterium tuberculosis]|nr:NUDIX domain-containing protein [Mycobacterium tuberculosis]